VSPISVTPASGPDGNLSAFREVRDLRTYPSPRALYTPTSSSPDEARARYREPRRSPSLVDLRCVTRAMKDAIAGAPTQPSPIARSGAPSLSSPLFSGAIYLADLHFDGGGVSWKVSPGDLATVMQYLQLVARPVSRYASQYGPNQWSMSPQLLSLSVAVPGGQYTDAELRGWVDQLVQHSSLPPSSAVFVLNPPGVVNSDAKESGGVGVLGYHGFATVPFSFVNLLGSGFALEDGPGLFAEAVSHELAEMIVDPRADGSNPEVCDGCGTNCLGAGAYRAYFNQMGTYLGASRQFPPGFPYTFFLSAIARPANATACPAPSSGCAYPPP
jgi:hypothetical protein